jgi:hypothetical protein
VVATSSKARPETLGRAWVLVWVAVKALGKV